MARTASQQVKVSAIDRMQISKLARLDGVTPSTWCYNVIQAALEAQKHRIPNAELNLTAAETAPETPVATRTPEAASSPPAPAAENGAMAYS